MLMAMPAFAQQAAASSAYRAAQADAQLTPNGASESADGFMRAEVPFGRIVKCVADGDPGDPIDPVTVRCVVGQKLVLVYADVYQLPGPSYFTADGMERTLIDGGQFERTGSKWVLALFLQSGYNFESYWPKSTSYGPGAGLQALHCSSWRSAAPQGAVPPGTCVGG
jgi:hypothetical protein